MTRDEEIDRTVDSWFLMKSPWPILSIIGAYLVFVIKLGPALMANRKPFNLRSLMVTYNAFQVIFSAWLSYLCFQQNEIITHLVEPNCLLKTREQNATLDIHFGAWFYFFSKVVDFLDTIFFVLRKKQNQVTFLHVYHHSSTALFSWGFLKYAKGEQGVLVGLVNSIVHVVMYFYYMLSAMGPNYRKYLWWKKYITRIQILQFVLIVSYMAVILVKDCQMSKTVSFLFLIFNTIFLVQFSGFYLKTYKKQFERTLVNSKKVI